MREIMTRLTQACPVERHIFTSWLRCLKELRVAIHPSRPLLPLPSLPLPKPLVSAIEI